jgi:hypothetical protein
MKSTGFLAALLPAVLAAAVPRSEKVDYAGYLGLRVTAPENAVGFEDKINDLAVHIMNPGEGAQLDVVVAPDNVDAIASISASTEVLIEDVGAVLAEEGDLISIAAGMLKNRHTIQYNSTRQYLSRSLVTNTLLAL